MKITSLLAALLAASAPAVAQPGSAQPESIVLDSMDENTLRAPEKATVSVVQGYSGHALKIDFAEDADKVFVQSRVRGTPEWDRAQGFSFWVRGDGSNHLGGIEVIWNEDYSRRYAFAFRISSPAWEKVMVRWSDLIPETAATPALALGTPGAEASKLGPISFGKWWYWSDYAAHSYTMDDIRLEPAIFNRVVPQPAGDPLARVRAKVRVGQPITVVTMGDSLTDFKHWSNRETNWPTMLAAKLKQKHGVEMKLVNPALGGMELRQNVVLLPRWVAQAPAPDLVTVFFGPNDWASGMRGPVFQSALDDAARRIRLATNGASDVLFVSTRPNIDKPEELSELAVAARASAQSQNVGLADVNAAFMAREDRASLFAWDKVHLSGAGQEVVADTVLRALEEPAALRPPG